MENILDIKTYTIPCYELEFFCDNKKGLELQVHWKANQKIKHINKGSRHTNENFKATPTRIFNHLAKLTRKEETLILKWMRNIYDIPII